MKHDYCARCGVSSKERGWYCVDAYDDDWAGNHIWTWNEGDSIIPHMGRKKRIEGAK